MDFFDFIKNNKFIVLSISIIFNILLLTSTGILLYHNLDKEDISTNIDTIEPSNSLSMNTEKENFFVEIKGAVNKPGVYKVSSDNIINDVITLAEGFTKNAYTDNINLSRQVSKEMVIYVYTKTDFKNTQKSNNPVKTVVVQEKCECPTYDITSCTENKQSEIVVNYNTNPTDGNLDSNVNVENNSTSNNVVNEEIIDNTNKKEDTNNSLINLNTASKTELMTLTGIGEAKAVKIIDYRNTKGKFKSIDEIKNVSGIGDAMFEKIKNNITV